LEKKIVPETVCEKLKSAEFLLESDTQTREVIFLNFHIFLSGDCRESDQ